MNIAVGEQHKVHMATSGRNYPLGATVDDSGVNFALFSANATRVTLCLFNESDVEVAQIDLPEYSDDIWHGHIAGLKVGQRYGYRVHGPFEPHNGHRFNASKLLIDPYAKQLTNNVAVHNLNYSYDTQSAQKDLTLDNRDNAAVMPKCVVTAPFNACKSHPLIRHRDTIIYELHVKGFSQLNKQIPKSLRGTFSALASEASCKYLKQLGVTCVELMPIHQFSDEAFIHEKGLSNYWGYNTVNFFSPHFSYLSQQDINEFRQMVNTLHDANIEVILDVVYNHSAEGNELGPTYSFKGIDNASYYRLLEHDKRFYHNYSGCGNTLDLSHPNVLQMVTDSLRYWVEAMGVDGFRFDLATALGRGQQRFSENNAFFNTIKQDPILAKVKLIAEPWDLAEDGYQLGQFPKQWLEWNDRFRDTCRQFWLGKPGIVAEFAKRLHGSSDLFETPSRRPSASVNFITCHDGFTLADLTRYQDKHNHANGEQNKDGHNSNFSDNFGFEGPTNDAKISTLRAKQQRNLLTTLFIAQGTPMLMAGDEFGNSQQGNNNAYCQDNDISWLNWQQIDSQEGQQLAIFVQELIALRKAHPLLNRDHYQHGEQHSPVTQLSDISWLNCEGQAMTHEDWHNAEMKCFAMLLANTENHKTVDGGDQNQAHIKAYSDDALLCIFNAHPHTIDFQLPELNGYWQQLLNTADDKIELSPDQGRCNERSNLNGSCLPVKAQSCVMLSYQQVKTAQTEFENKTKRTDVKSVDNKEYIYD